MAKVSNSDKSSAEIASLAKDRKPDLEARTNLGLLKDGKTIHVGDDAEYVLDLFPKSMAPHAFDVHELPKSLPSPPYSAKGWDSPSGEGFGEIVYNRQIGAAMWIRVFSDDAGADAVIQEYKTQTTYPPRAPVAYNGISYLFWDALQQRQLIVKQPLSGGRFSLTIWVGDDVILDALGITPEGARRDLGILQRNAILSKGN